MTETKLWDRFSIFIRLRDTNADGFGFCFTCGKPKFWRDGDAGHGIGRQHKATFLDERNVHFQCKPCNGFEGGAREKYEREVCKRYGPQAWDLLVLKSRSTCKRGKFELKVLFDHYGQEIKKLLATKNFTLEKY